MPSLNGFYRATVMANEDSESMGRVQVRVLSLFDGISDADLPWAAPAFPSYWVLIPAVGDSVFCFFEVGDPLKPVYFAGAPGKPDLIHSDEEKYTFQSPHGSKVEIDDSSDTITIQDKSGNKIVLTAGGITVTPATGKSMDVVGGALPRSGVVTGAAICPMIGSPHPVKVDVLKAGL